MQYDRVMKKLNFDLLLPPPNSIEGVRHRPSIKSGSMSFIFIVPLSACEISVKILTTY